MTNEEKDKKEYELGVLLTREEDLSGVLALLTSHGGEMTSEARARKLALAYEIKGHKEGVFASVIFKAYGDGVKALEHDLGLRAEVLRSLVIKTPKPSLRPMGTGAPGGATPLPGGERPRAARTPSSDQPRPAAPRPLSNEALEKKLEEILG
jgi:ribosomal protein S6